MPSLFLSRGWLCPHCSPDDLHLLNKLPIFGVIFQFTLHIFPQNIDSAMDMRDHTLPLCSLRALYPSIATSERGTWCQFPRSRLYFNSSENHDVLNLSCDSCKLFHIIWSWGKNNHIFTSPGILYSHLKLVQLPLYYFRKCRTSFMPQTYRLNQLRSILQYGVCRFSTKPQSHQAALSTPVYQHN